MTERQADPKDASAAGPPRASTSNGRADTDDPQEMPEADKPEILVKLQERKKRHAQRGLPARVGVVVLGVILVLGGIVLSGPGIPGPGFVLVLLGLSFLALEFDRAERLLGKVIVWADKAKARADAMTRKEKAIAATIGVLLLAAFVLWAIFYDIPLLPIV